LNGARESSGSASESAAPTCVEILDLQGRVVQRLVVGSAGAAAGASGVGVNAGGGGSGGGADAVSGVAWNGRDRSGVPVAAGVYLYRLTGALDSRALRMQVLR